MLWQAETTHRKGGRGGEDWNRAEGKYTSSPSRLRKQEGTAQNCKDSDNKHKERDRRKQKHKRKKKEKKSTTKKTTARFVISSDYFLIAFPKIVLKTGPKGLLQSDVQKITKESKSITSKNKFIRGLHIKNNF